MAEDGPEGVGPEGPAPWAPLEPPDAGPPAAPGPQAWWPAADLPKAGDARTGPLPLHPMNVSDVLDGAFKLFKANAHTVLLVTAAFVVPLHLIAAFAQRHLLGGRGFLTVMHDPLTAQATADQRSAAEAEVAAVAGLLLLLVTPFVAGAISRVVAASYLGERLDAGPALRATGRRTFALLAAWFLVHLLEVVGAVLCLLPGLLVMALFVGVAPAIVIEELGPVAGMRRSARLLRPRIFPVLGTALLAGLLASVLGNVLGGIPNAVALAIGLRWAWPLLAAGSILSSLVTIPFVAIVATLLYFDGRIRQEGLDLQLMADDLARRLS